MATEWTTFKGSPTLTFDDGSGYPFSLGVKKLRTIMEHIDDVREWLAANGQPAAKPATRKATAKPEPAGKPRGRKTPAKPVKRKR